MNDVKPQFIIIQWCKAWQKEQMGCNGTDNICWTISKINALVFAFLFSYIICMFLAFEPMNTATSMLFNKRQNFAKQKLHHNNETELNDCLSSKQITPKIL